jgi:O-antigen/teichoic acid export membrane protein
MGRGAIAALLGQIVGRGSEYGVGVIVGRALGAPVLGAVELILRMIRIAGMLTMVGLPHANNKFIAQSLAHEDARGVRAIARKTGILSIVLAVLSSVAIFCLAPVLALDVYHRPELLAPMRLAGLAAPALALTLIILAIPQAARNIWPQVLIARMGVPALFLLGVPIALYLGGELTAVISTYVAASFVGLILAAGLRGRWLPGESGTGHTEASFREILGFSGVVYIGSIGVFMTNLADVFVIGKFVSEHDLGIYAAAARTASFITFPLFSINSLFAPTISDLYARGATEALRETYRTAARWTAGAGAGVYGLMAIAPQQILSVFGSEFHEGMVPLVLLGAGYFVNSATGGVGWLLTMTGNHRIAAFTNWMAGAVLATSLFFVVPKYGLLGAAICTGSAMAVSNLVKMMLVWWKLGVIPLTRRYLSSLAVTATVILVLRALCATGGPGWSPQAIWALGLFAVCHTAVFLLGWAPEAVRRGQ